MKTRILAILLILLIGLPCTSCAKKEELPVDPVPEIPEFVPVSLQFICDENGFRLDAYKVMMAESDDDWRGFSCDGEKLSDEIRSIIASEALQQLTAVSAGNCAAQQDELIRSIASLKGESVTVGLQCFVEAAVNIDSTAISALSLVDCSLKSLSFSGPELRLTRCSGVDWNGIAAFSGLKSLYVDPPAGISSSEMTEKGWLPSSLSILEGMDSLKQFRIVIHPDDETLDSFGGNAVITKDDLSALDELEPFLPYSRQEIGSFLSDNDMKLQVIISR